MTRIAIVSAPGSDLEKIRAAFRNPMKFTVREFLSMESVVHDLISFPMEVLVMRLPRFSNRHLAVALKARRRFHQASVLMIAKDVEPAVRAKAAALEKFRLLQEPHEVGDLAGVVGKLVRNDVSALRLHPRARREGSIQIVDSRGVIHHGQFCDFGQMGARVTVPSLKKFEPRESVQLIYGSLSEVGKRHRIEAKVVWSNPQFAGLRFIAAY